MNEVVFYVRFVTGTTSSDPEQAKQMCRKMLEDGLRAAHLIPQEGESGTGLFDVSVLGEHVEKL